MSDAKAGQQNLHFCFLRVWLAVSCAKGSILLHAPFFSGCFLLLSLGLKGPVFAGLENGFACSQKLLCSYSSTASGAFNICPVSPFCTRMSWVLSLACKVCAKVFLCWLGTLFCAICTRARIFLHACSPSGVAPL